LEMKAAERRAKILDALEEHYPDAKCALIHSNPFELLVATILSAQCTDERVNLVTARLFQKYKTPQDFARLTPKELEEEIKELGLFRNKAKNIVAMSQKLLLEYGGDVPKDRESLESLPGVGRKTANVVLSNAFDIPAIAVDTHVFRVANRLGLVSRAPNPLAVERQLMKNIPKDRWSQAHHWLIHHGRQVCEARKPKCDVCPLLPYCPEGKRRTMEATK